MQLCVFMLAPVHVADEAVWPPRVLIKVCVCLHLTLGSSWVHALPVEWQRMLRCQARMACALCVSFVCGGGGAGGPLLHHCYWTHHRNRLSPRCSAEDEPVAGLPGVMLSRQGPLGAFTGKLKETMNEGGRALAAAGVGVWVCEVCEWGGGAREGCAAVSRAVRKSNMKYKGVGPAVRRGGTKEWRRCLCEAAGACLQPRAPLGASSTAPSTCSSIACRLLDRPDRSPPVQHWLAGQPSLGALVLSHLDGQVAAGQPPSAAALVEALAEAVPSFDDRGMYRGTQVRCTASSTLEGSTSGLAS